MKGGALLRERPLQALLLAELVSTTGMQMTWLALPWFVLITTGSATRMTLVMAAELVGLGLFGLPGGKVLGRLGARRTMLVCDGARAPLMAVVPLLHWAGGLSFGALLAVALGLGVFGGPYFAAQKVILPELLGEDERRIGEANALFQGATRGTLLLGPVAAGVLIGAIGATSVLLVDAATYLVSLGLVAGFVPQPDRSVAESDQGGILEGLRFIASDPLLRVWRFAIALGDAAWTAFFATVPVLVVDRFGADARIAGWLFASFGVGALVGNAIAYRFLLRKVQGLTLIAAAVMGQALPLWLLFLPVPAAALSGVLALSGLANGLVNPSLHTIMTLRVPPRLRPTVMTSMMLIWALANPLGLIAAGPVLDAAGATPVLIGFAAVQTAMMGLIALASLRARAAGRESSAPLGGIEDRDPGGQLAGVAARVDRGDG